MEEATRVGGVERYAHLQGDIFFQKRSPLQLASTLGFVLQKQSGKFMGLRPQELNSLHEILCWGMQRGNNNILAWFGNTLEDFTNSCRSLLGQKFTHVLPKGSNLVKIRVSAKQKLKAKEGTLGQTLGDEPSGMVVVDLRNCVYRVMT